MATRQEAANKKKELSGQISTLIRTLSLSVLAVAWLFLSRNDNAGELAESIRTPHLLFISGLCVVAIGLDLLQYIAGFLSVSRDYARAKASSEPNNVVYSDSSLRNFAFVTKIIFAVIAAIYLVTMLFLAVAAETHSIPKTGSVTPSIIIVVH